MSSSQRMRCLFREAAKAGTGVRPGYRVATLTIDSVNSIRRIGKDSKSETDLVSDSMAPFSSAILLLSSPIVSCSLQRVYSLYSCRSALPNELRQANDTVIMSPSMTQSAVVIQVSSARAGAYRAGLENGKADRAHWARIDFPVRGLSRNPELMFG